MWPIPIGAVIAGLAAITLYRLKLQGRDRWPLLAIIVIASLMFAYYALLILYVATCSPGCL